MYVQTALSVLPLVSIIKKVLAGALQALHIFLKLSDQLIVQVSLPLSNLSRLPGPLVCNT
jgi:hypothetical protein